jgi:hypothetical protein
VLVGNGAGVNLVETAGNNLLIGGTGSATIDSGSGEDIVIGGSTTYDSNATALNAIETYWLSQSSSEATGVSVLTTTGTPTGNYKLNSSTVTHAVNVKDTLHLGSSSDWVFYRLSGTYADNLTGTPLFQTFI